MPKAVGPITNQDVADVMEYVNIKRVEKLTQAQWDALSSPRDTTTLFVIVG